MRVNTVGGWAVMGLLVGLSACSPGGAPGGPGAGGPPAVSVVPAVARQVQEADEFTARLEAPDTVALRARVAGTLEGVHFKEGQLVSKGQLLFTLDARPFQAEVGRAEAQLAAARSQADLARSELARAEKLVDIQAVSGQEIDQLRAAVRNAQAQAQSAQALLTQAQLNLGYTRITSPVAGRSSRTGVTVGNLVGVGEPVLTTVVSTDRIHAYFDASEALYLKYGNAARAGTQASAPAAATVKLGLANEQGFAHTGRLDFVDNRLDTATGTVRARAVFDNKDGRFTPGLSARLQLSGAGAFDAVLVPERAITTDQNRKLVLVVGDKNIVQPRPVEVGALVGGMRVVKGVKAGESVIVEGLLRAFPGAPVTPQVLKVDAEGMPLPTPPAAAPKG
jgi:RND family efflux transporter MFP subunit